MAGKIGAPYGNKNAAGGGKKGGGSTTKALKYAPGKIHYDSPKFLKAAARQKRIERGQF